MNQFVDGAVILATTPRKIGFLVAEKSYMKPIIGHFARAVGSIPVARPQDTATKGKGEIMIIGLLMKGSNTKFRELDKRCKIRPGKSADSYGIREVVSDEEAWLIEEEGERSPTTEPQNTWMTYDIIAHIDQSKVSIANRMIC